jgi:hypothetical protein
VNIPVEAKVFFKVCSGDLFDWVSKVHKEGEKDEPGKYAELTLNLKY